MKLTLVIEEGRSGFLVGQIKEIPGVITQGTTIEEVKENILDALELYLEDMREDFKGSSEKKVYEGDVELA
ncbi:type II toxin-antitoxin system HicB family antitoxin [Adhaeribacter rhizoryzae]|uniref:Type II toxin-antitoxin system HicB family antitoxin n=1 Tax=Adhaeribacter rhizoryzae TaxID=2607907 RepID=A0A5M6D9K5_9BACT|nr:type II toxin-antitoxin system HicB family antitoxin [Adhaeribacter rhizoryzae]KAA5544227.1 type II toxin-antitoxin system HicB family antitoxin [Adhaeribacter rhizoryzae]